MIAFAANSVLGRLALDGTDIDAYSYTSIRLISAAITLVLLLVLIKGARVKLPRDWLSAFMLFGYAMAFSLAYLRLETAMGALILFGIVQLTMIGWGIVSGERLSASACVGVFMACGAFIYLMLPGLSAPDTLGAVLMAVSGICWGVYSLLGRHSKQKGGGDPLARTSSNFVWSLPFMTVSLVIYTLGFGGGVTLPIEGIVLAVMSGAVTSGAGYAIWYRVLKDLTATRASIVQLSVPVIAAIGGVVFVSEPLTLRLSLATIFILGGIALTLMPKTQSKPE